MVAPSQSAADVLPRPVFGKNKDQPRHETPQQPTNGAAAAKADANGHGPFSTALSLIASLPLTEGQKADALKRLLAEPMGESK